MSDKKIVNVTTEHVPEKSTDFIASLVTVGLVGAGNSEHYSTTVTYDDGTVSNGIGDTKESSIKDAVK